MSQALMKPIKQTHKHFTEYFNRVDGAVNNNWRGATWVISSGKAVNTPTLGAELIANPGAEGTYTDGVAPDWIKIGSDVTLSEETTIINGGTSAQKVVGGTVTAEGCTPANSSVVSGSWYIWDAWIRNDGPGSVQVARANGRLPNIVYSLPETDSEYDNQYRMDRAITTGTERIQVRQIGTTPQTFYCDDHSLKAISFPTMFMTRLFNASDVTLLAGINYDKTGKGFVAIVSNLDDPANPLNFVWAYYTGSNLVLSKFVNGVETRLINVVSTSFVNGDLFELRKSGTTYKIYYSGSQVGTDQTISDAGIINNRYVGLGTTLTAAEASYNSFSVRDASAEVPVEKNNTYIGSTYTTGQGIVSLRFDDGVALDYSYTRAELNERSLCGGFAVIRGYIGVAEKLTLAQALEMQTEGHEIMAHSRSHGDDPTDFATFIDQTATAAYEMRLMGFNIDSFVQPGTWDNEYHLNDPGGADADADAFLKRHFIAYEAYSDAFDDGNRYNLPRSERYGVSHITGDELSLVTLQGVVDSCITNGQGAEILFHSNNIDTGGDNISAADFETFLDYLQTKVGLGTLTVLTPTQQLFATVAA